MSPASENQLARAAAQVFDRRHRVWVGPLRAYVNRALFAAGEPVTLPAATATTSETWGHSDTINVTSTSGYDSSGMVALTHASGTGWYSYTGKTSTAFTGAKFSHGYSYQPVGATVANWLDISDRVTRCQGQEQERGRFHLWTYDLAGERYDSLLMPNDATVLIEERLSPDGSWPTATGWIVAALGYARRWESAGDVDRRRRWSATVESVVSYIDSHLVAARTYGPTNLAEGASVTASPHLANPLLELGEFGGALGTTVAENVTDGFDDTLYISEVAPTSVPETPGSSGASEFPVIDEVYLQGPAGTPASLQYIVIKLPPDSPEYLDPTRNGVGLRDYVLTTKATVYVPSHVPTRPDEVQGGGFYIRLPEVTLTADNDTLILCQNRQTFERYFSVAGRAQVYEWRTLPGFGNDHFPAQSLTLDPAGDVLHLRNAGRNVVQAARDMVVWTEGAAPPDFEIWSGAEDEEESAGQWSPATPVPAPGPGESIRRYPTCKDANKATDWITETEPNPADRRTNTDNVFVSVELPEFSVTLEEPMTSSSPAGNEWVTLSDPTYLPASGVVQIDGEHLAYWQRSATAIKLTIDGRGYNGTTPAGHSVGAAVFRYDPILGAHRMPTVESVEIRRRSRAVVVDGIGVFRNIASCAVWATTMDEPRYPGEADFRMDWIGGGALVNFEAPLVVPPSRLTLPLPVAQPLRHVMLLIRRMSDGGRAKLDELLVWRDEVSNGAVAAGGIAGVLRHLLSEVLDDSEIVIDTDEFVGLGVDMTLTENTLGDILRDLAEQYALIIQFTRDGKVEVRRDPRHPLAQRPDIHATIVPAMIRGKASPQRVTRASRIGLGQVIVTLESNGQIIEGRYPPNPGPGDVRKVGPLRVPLRADGVRGATYYAQMLYLSDEAISHRYTFATSGPAEWLAVGQRVLLFDYSDDARDEGRYVNARIVGVTHNAEGVEEVEAVEWRFA